MHRVSVSNYALVQRISDPTQPTPRDRVFGRFNVPIAPAQVAAFSDGRVVVVYDDHDAGEVYARIVSPDYPLSPEIALHAGTPPFPSAASVAVLRSDDFIVVYQGEGKILARIYKSDGSLKASAIELAEFSRVGDSRNYREGTPWAPSVWAFPADATCTVAWSKAGLEVEHVPQKFIIPPRTIIKLRSSIEYCIFDTGTSIESPSPPFSSDTSWSIGGLNACVQVLQLRPDWKRMGSPPRPGPCP